MKVVFHLLSENYVGFFMSLRRNFVHIFFILTIKRSCGTIVPPLTLLFARVDTWALVVKSPCWYPEPLYPHVFHLNSSRLTRLSLLFFWMLMSITTAFPLTWRHLTSTPTPPNLHHRTSSACHLLRRRSAACPNTSFPGARAFSPKPSIASLEPTSPNPALASV